MSAEDWTEERVAKLKTLWLQGVSCSQIAKEVNKLPGCKVTRNAVIGKRVRLGLPGRATPTKPARKPKPKPLPPMPRTIAKPTRAAPPTVPAPVKLHPPKISPTSVRFIDAIAAKRKLCLMFCDGQSLSTGYVCGRPARHGAYCVECLKLIYAPQPPMRPVKREKAA